MSREPMTKVCLPGALGGGSDKAILNNSKDEHFPAKALRSSHPFNPGMCVIFLFMIVIVLVDIDSVYGLASQRRGPRFDSWADWRHSGSLLYPYPLSAQQ